MIKPGTLLAPEMTAIREKPGVAGRKAPRWLATDAIGEDWRGRGHLGSGI
jgi:hypothetical protein